MSMFCLRMTHLRLTRLRLTRRAMSLAISALLVAPTVAAGPFQYTVDDNQSQLNLTASGNVFGGALEVSEQHANSPTKYGGTITAAFPDTPRPGGSIRFPGGSAAAGQNLRGGFFNTELGVTPGIGGSGGTDPANYGLTFGAPLDIALPDIPLPDELGGITLSLGTLTSVDINLALRDVVWDVQQNVPGGKASLDAIGDFNAAGGIQLALVSGSADVSGALVLTQDNFLAAGALELALGALVGQVPQLGLSVSRPGGFLSTDVHIGIGTGLDLSSLGGNLGLPNGAVDPGNVTFNELTGASTLTLPIDISLGDLGIPPELLDLELGFSGQFVANAVVAVPEPTGATALAFAACGWIGLRGRRRRVI